MTVKVAHDGAADQRPARHPDALREPGGGDFADRGRGGAGQRGGEREREAGKEHGLPAVTVGERAPQQLARGEADEERRERELRRVDAGAERFGDRRQRRNVEIGAERGEGDQHAEQKGE